MTSTNIYHGHEGRSSSRVLKPPGGGHTDLFGGEEESSRAKNKRAAQRSTISECLSSSSVSSTSTVTQQKVVVENGEAKQQHQEVVEHQVPDQTVSESKVDSPVAEEKPELKEAAKHDDGGKKVRVPPGGFSSGGFW